MELKRDFYDFLVGWKADKNRQCLLVNGARQIERDAANAACDAMAEKLRQTVRNLKAMKLATEQISAATGLSAEEIEAL
ncbi:MAG: hypothetical protein K6G94_06675 [Kiritimatiellae bacterium]|nr:hypothetical protein [Kiritimatiellia bacterium]